MDGETACVRESEVERGMNLLERALDNIRKELEELTTRVIIVTREPVPSPENPKTLVEEPLTGHAKRIDRLQATANRIALDIGDLRERIEL